jgi:hypothetical protein
MSARSLTRSQYDAVYAGVIRILAQRDKYWDGKERFAVAWRAAYKGGLDLSWTEQSRIKNACHLIREAAKRGIKVLCRDFWDITYYKLHLLWLIHRRHPDATVREAVLDPLQWKDVSAGSLELIARGMGRNAAERSAELAFHIRRIKELTGHDPA